MVVYVVLLLRYTPQQLQWFFFFLCLLRLNIHLPLLLFLLLPALLLCLLPLPLLLLLPHLLILLFLLPRLFHSLTAVQDHMRGMPPKAWAQLNVYFSTNWGGCMSTLSTALATPLFLPESAPNVPWIVPSCTNNKHCLEMRLFFKIDQNKGLTFNKTILKKPPKTTTDRRWHLLEERPTKVWQWVINTLWSDEGKGKRRLY